jgi:hypothetical protein
MWLAIFCALSALWCMVCLTATFLIAKNASAASALLRRNLHSCESSMRSHAASLTELESVVASIAHSIKMTKVRKALTHTDRDKGGEPDAKSDPEAWRAWKNAQLRAGVYNN